MSVIALLFFGCADSRQSNNEEPSDSAVLQVAQLDFDSLLISSEDAELQSQLKLLFSKVIRANPDAEATSELAMTLDANNLGSTALKLYQYAIELQPTNFELQYLYSRRLKQEGNLPQAIAVARSAIELNPSYAALHLQLGNWLLESGDISGAQVSFEQALAQNAGPAASISLAKSYIHANKPVEAYETLQPIVAQTRHPAALRLMATVWQTLGETEQARRLLEEAQFARSMWFEDPIGESILRFARGMRRELQDVQTLLANGQVDEAIATLHGMEVTYPASSNLELAYHLGLAYAQKQQHEKAADYLLIAINIESTHYPSHLLLAKTYVDVGRLGEAQRHLEEVTSIYPNLRIAHQELGFVKLELDDKKGALASLQNAATLDAVEPTVYYAIGALLGEQDRCRDALPYFKRSLDVDPTFERAHFGIRTCEEALAIEERLE